jgi:hypothetical protein
VPTITYTDYSSDVDMTNNWSYELLVNRPTMPEHGWVTAYSAKMRNYNATPSGGSNPAALALYKDRALVDSSALTVTATTTTSHARTLPAPVPFSSGSYVHYAVWREGASDADDLVVVKRSSSTASYAHERYTQFPSAAPATLPSSTAGGGLWGTGYGFAGSFTYIANQAPSTGVAIYPLTGAATGTAVTFEGTLPHPETDVTEYSNDYELIVYEAANPSNIAHSTTYATTSGEKASGTFEREVTGLTVGMTYAWKYRHRDSFNVWSAAYSTPQTFTVGESPYPPAPTAPVGKVNAITGYNYTAAYEHPTGTAADRAEIEVYNSTGSTLLYTTETASPGGYVVSVADGGTITVPEFHADLSWDTDYRWRIRARDTAGFWGSWSSTPAAGTQFNTNATPVAPTNLAPTGDLYTPGRVLTANVTDPDGDAITGAQAVVETDAGVAIAGSPYAMTISGTAPNQVATVTIPSGDVTLGTRYRWRARATDGFTSGYGPYSSDSYWHYQNVPDVSVVVADPQVTPAPSFTASYNHLSSLARTHKRIVLQKYANGAWSLTGGYDSGWVADAGAAGGTFAVTFPANTVRNHNLYRLKVYARDTGLGEGETPYHEFETAYTGPPTLTVNVAQGVPEEAAIELVWGASTLTVSEFAGIEVQKATPGGEEDTETVALITDPAATSYTYHFPVSNRTYTLSVRQIENVGVEQVEGDWTDSTLSVDYSPYHFIKDAHDPSLFVAYETQASRLPAPQYEGLDAEFLTWGGEVVQLAGGRDYASGEVAMEFYEESAIEASADERYRLAREILKGRRTLVILTQVPEADKVFVVRKGAYVKTWTPPRTRALSFSWREARYSEDYYVRNAATVTYTP